MKIKKPKNIFYIFLISLILTFFSVSLVKAKTIPDQTYPRIANYFLNWDLNAEQARELAKWDVVVLDIETQEKHLDLIKKIKQLNPDIILLAYITPQEIKINATNSGSIFREKFSAGILENWYLKNSQAKKLSWWSGTNLLNITDQNYINYLINYLKNNVLSSGVWDGIFYDNAWDNITWFAGSDIDYNLDGKVDTSLDQKWRSGMQFLYNETNRLTNNKYIIVGNNNNVFYKNELDGMMFENFSEHSWNEIMNNYKILKNNPLNIINNNTKNSGKINYKSFRFGLVNSLLGNAYYSYDFGDQNHGQLWWYDEYDVDLGSALNEAYSENNLSTYKNDVWRRDFDHGIVLVNSTNDIKTIDLKGEYEKINGVQDKTINNGSIVSEVDIFGQDGLILLKTFEGLKDVLYKNGSFVRFIRPDASRVRNGFFVFEEGFKGGYLIAKTDLDGNKKEELLVASNNKIQIWRDDGQLLMKSYPYGANYAGDIKIAIGDLNGDNLKEIYVAPDKGYKLPIKIYTRHGKIMRKDFYPFGENYDGGYSLAVGLAEKKVLSKRQELFIATNSWINIFNYDLEKIISFRAFENTYYGGVKIDVGDIDGDGTEEIVTAKENDEPVIKIFDMQGNVKSGPTKAYASFASSGINDIKVQDVDFDGKEDILVFSESF
ncbi:MAG: putative glycoside hydrolase [Patescibacteria group bacterium]